VQAEHHARNGYAYFCPHCREELTQPVFTAMDVFEYPELHDESIAFNNFFRQLCKLMSACGVKDFSCRVGGVLAEWLILR
jgi:hypothetical protein